jgi:hypothetical protein
MSETKNNMVSEVKRKKPNIRNVNIEHKQSLKKIDRLALAITERFFYSYFHLDSFMAGMEYLCT